MLIIVQAMSYITSTTDATQHAIIDKYNFYDRRVGVVHRQGIDHGDYYTSCRKFIPIRMIVIIMFII